MNTTPTRPPTMPTAANASSSHAEPTLNGGSDRNVRAPSNPRATVFASTEASAITTKDTTEKSSRMISRAKNTPATGALNVAEIPPAAPQATRRRSRLSDTRHH